MVLSFDNCNRTLTNILSSRWGAKILQFAVLKFSQFRNPILILKNAKKLIYYIFSCQNDLRAKNKDLPRINLAINVGIKILFPCHQEYDIHMYNIRQCFRRD